MNNELKLKFTGKMSVIVEVEEHGPIVMNINDFDITHKTVLFILNQTDDSSTPVDSYNKREEAKFKKMLDNIK